MLSPKRRVFLKDAIGLGQMGEHDSPLVWRQATAQRR